MEDHKIIDWLEALGSKTPTPGGGAVAGLNGAIAVAQLKMICEYTKNKLNGDLNLNEKVRRFIELSEKDSEVYLAVKEAYRSSDKDQIQQALANAIIPSKKIVVNCEEIYKFCEVNLNSFNKNLISDLIVALVNLSAAVESAQTMLNINSESMDEGQIKNQTKENIEKCSQLISKINDLKNKVKAEKL